MISVIVGILNIAWTISLMSSIYMALVFWRNRKNPLMNIFCIFVILLSIDVLLSLIYFNDLTKVPREFCIFQALMLQFCAYAIGIIALCFSMQTYRRIVLNSRENHRTKLFYYSICFLYPCIMITILAIVAIKYDSISPGGMTCDIMSPTWMRLLGYTGPNLILSPLGVYWSSRTALKVFRQQDKIEKDAIELDNSSKSDSTTLSEEPINKNISSQEGSNDEKKFYPLLSLPLPISNSTVSSNKPPDHAKYRVAAKRLASFALGILLMNGISSLSTLWDVIKNSPMLPKIGSSDVIGSLVGISIFLIFGGLRAN